MTTPEIRKDVRYTWDDYRTWWDDKRWELIGGEAFDMSPAPLVRHQAVAGRLFAKLDDFFRNHPCRLLFAPIDVKLSDDDVVQPDLIVVCDPAQITRTHIEGPPTLAIEILSPSSVPHDHVTKFQLYARFGVKEYWIVTPYPPLVEVYVLDGDHYRMADGYEDDDTLVSPTFPGLEMELAGVFDFPVDPSERVNVVKEARPPYAPPKRAPASTPAPVG
jgi:Uma2 family endonuclease